jgi:nucleoside-diphosphate-sugar epimerase
MLFLHNILGAGNKVRIFGTVRPLRLRQHVCQLRRIACSSRQPARSPAWQGTNKCSFCHVDNYCHGLILGERALVPGGKALGRFYIVTDGAPQDFWRSLDVALVAVGCRSVFAKARLPKWFILPIAYLAVLLGALLRRRFKLNPFAARMLMIHRWFDIEAARTDLGYDPIVPFEQGWADTVEWFRTVWAPVHGPNRKRQAA